MKAFKAIEAAGKAQGWPVRYPDDLAVIDKAQCEKQGDGKAFLWAVRESGTHMIALDLPVCRPGVQWGPQPHRSYVESVSRYFTASDVLWYCWTGRELQPVSLASALDIATDADATAAKAHAKVG